MATDELAASELFDEPSRWREAVVEHLGLVGEQRCAGASTSVAMPQLIEGFARRLWNDPIGAALDVGGGLGPSSAWLAERTGHRFTSLDPSPEACSAARRLFGVSSARAVSSDLPIPAASCSAVLLNGVVSLLDDLDSTIDEATRVTRPGGLIGVADLTAIGDQRVTTPTNTFWTRGELGSQLVQAGCLIIDVFSCETNLGRWADVQERVSDEITDRYAEHTGFDEWRCDRERLESLISGGEVICTMVIARRGAERT